MADKHHSSEGHGKKGHGHGGGHGGGHEEAHEGAPEWLISFADMVMLMMGFFVILFALNNKPASRNPGGASDDTDAEQTGGSSDQHMLDLAIAVREAFNNPVSMNSTDPRDQPLIHRLIERAGKSEAVDPGVKGHEQDVTSIRPSDYYAVSGNVPFGENSSDLTPTARSTIGQVADRVRGLNLVVEVRGHVSSVEAARGPDVSMKLSADRALNVAEALAAAGVDWWRMRLVLSADHDRIDRYPKTREADRPNARVEVILTDEVVPDPIPTRYD